MSQYAAKTSVSVAKSKAETESILNKYDATEFAYGTKPGFAAIGFVAHGKQIRDTMKPPRDFRQYQRPLF